MSGRGIAESRLLRGLKARGSLFPWYLGWPGNSPTALSLKLLLYARRIQVLPLSTHLPIEIDTLLCAKECHLFLLFCLFGATLPDLEGYSLPCNWDLLLGGHEGTR